MKLQTQLITGILGLSAFFTLPAIAQPNQLENFFAGTPPYRGDRINRPLNQIEGTQDSDYTKTQESVPTTPLTDTQSQRVTHPSNQTEYPQDSESQSSAVTTPMTSENFVNPNRNSAY
jgi:hypothetical protein